MAEDEDSIATIAAAYAARGKPLTRTTGLLSPASTLACYISATSDNEISAGADIAMTFWPLPMPLLAELLAKMSTMAFRAATRQCDLAPCRIAEGVLSWRRLSKAEL